MGQSDGIFLEDENVNDCQSTTPVLFDNVESNSADWNHTPLGSNVLYMDGHVSFVKFEEKGAFSVNRSFANVMEAMRSHPTFVQK